VTWPSTLRRLAKFERIGGEEAWSGKIVDVHVDRFRYEDGTEKDREIIRHPGAVVILAHDGERVYMVTQPREAVGQEALLELPAGKLDVEGEEPLDAAKRELAEEIGKGANDWQKIKTFWTSPGLLDEEMHLYLATELYDQQADSDEDERIEIEPVPLADLDGLIDRCRDAKSIVGLLWLKAYGDPGA
jgi:8-oxo-dGTP pyrophosphatase MutT (NUDIX family)